MSTNLSFDDPIGKRRRLAELGLEEEWLLQAVQQGHAAWATCTKNHPPMFGGISAWAETVRALREILLPLGWERSDEANLPFTVNAANTLALAVSTGDEDTGISEGSPCTKSNKGPRTRNAVSLNQFNLFAEIQVRPEALASIKNRNTWFLLMHRDTQKRELRCELSRPIEMNDEGRVDGWYERIILQSTPFDGEEIDVSGDSGPQNPDIIVDVKRRVN